MSSVQSADRHQQKFMSKLIIAKGLPYSGRTPWCKSTASIIGKKIVRISKDDMRDSMFDGWNPANEEFISELERKVVTLALEAGYDVVVDALNLNARDYDRWNEVSKSIGSKKNRVEVELIYKTFHRNIGIVIVTDLLRKLFGMNNFGIKTLIKLNGKLKK